MITTSPLKNVETAIRHSISVVAIDFTKTSNDSMHMMFDATVVVSVTVDGVNHLVKVNRVANSTGLAAEGHETSGYASLAAALDEALGADAKRHDIDRAIFRAAERALDDDTEERTGKIESLFKLVRAAEATGDATVRGMTTELLVRTLLERHHLLLNAVSGIRGLARLVSIGHLPDSSLSEVLGEFATVYSRIKRSTGVGLEALRKAAEVPVAEVASTLDTLYTDVVLP
ncbi:hypothetical protein [Burkholderia cenocepacia]|uniref:hypothetical protein n=1 Tax=Burkholderia cenocepacia TaxID=95486 RepID=UPI0026562068|nr:hypothetical protein [Burkholderia cenocepacia]MDN7536792.1 hypothetical protein [Burkholderia cenocepacia]